MTINKIKIREKRTETHSRVEKRRHDILMLIEFIRLLFFHETNRIGDK